MRLVQSLDRCLSIRRACRPSRMVSGICEMIPFAPQSSNLEDCWACSADSVRPWSVKVRGHLRVIGMDE